MAKITDIYDQIYSWENLYWSYENAGKGKWFRDDVVRFSANFEEELINIQNHLMYQTYAVGRYREFYVYEPKKRLIMALAFRDRVVQWAIYRQLEPLFDKQFIYDSYGCRKGKGTHRAADRLQYWMRAVTRKPDEWYYLKLDISKYFYRVDHDCLMRILRNKIDDERTLWLLKTIITCEHKAFGLPAGVDPDQCEPEDRLNDVGMPIGNLTSQLFANIYLNELDQYAKHDLKLRHYIRYMDDVIILHPDKKYLAEVKEQIEIFLQENLRLDLNNKTAIRKVKSGIEFVGFRIYPTHRKLKKKSTKKMKSRLQYLSREYARGNASLETVRSSVMSYYGIMQHFNSYGLCRHISQNITFQRGGIETGCVNIGKQNDTT